MQLRYLAKPRLEALQICFLNQLICLDEAFRYLQDIARSRRKEPQWYRDLQDHHSGVPPAIIQVPPPSAPMSSDWDPGTPADHRLLLLLGPKPGHLLH